MRFSAGAIALTICLMPAAGEMAGAAPEDPTDTPAPAPAPAPVPAPAPASAPGEQDSGANSDAAARHAKRTACLKSAKAKKLLGADKTAFIKNCVAAP
jgi:hypothetical protein